MPLLSNYVSLLINNVRHLINYVSLLMNYVSLLIAFFWGFSRWTTRTGKMCRLFGQARAARSVLDCGGKADATPLWRGRGSRRFGSRGACEGGEGRSPNPSPPSRDILTV